MLKPFYKFGIFWYALVLLCAFAGWTIRHQIQTSRLRVDESSFPEGHPTYYQSISLERTACYGTCPVYTVILHRDGRAEYKPRAHLAQQGDFEGEINSYEFERLSYLLEKNGFERMNGSYKAGFTDAATCIVTASSSSGAKKVSDYGGAGPINLWVIQQLIDGIRARTDWKPVPKASP
ncbi:DUF6438 domain-containing protein [Luteolibacter sp. Y139]|uniref:DUF6438 domain-containing protein n=2 Tax=Luteolibacter soli TaxID=3135280 RepID=A0ABU9ATH1_9BACT